MNPKWLVIWYDGNRQRAALVDDRAGGTLPYGASNNAALRGLLASREEDFQVNAVVEITGELGMVVLDDAEVELSQLNHVVLGA